MKKYILSIFSSLSLLTLAAQDVVNVTLLQTTTAQEISTVSGINASFDVDSYSILYTTTGSDGLLDTASGLICLPVTNDERPTIIYQHGTVDGREDVMSNMNAADTDFTILMAGVGYITTATDYLGLGVSRGFHPYVHAETQASAAIDLLIAARSYFDNSQINYNDQLFVTGYSQGGPCSYGCLA